MALDLPALRRIIADENRLLTGADIPAEYQSDVLGRVHGSAEALAFPLSTEEVSALLRSLALQNGALDFIELSDARQCADIWRVRGALVKAVEAVSEQEPVDIVVPISRTADFIRFINDLEAQSGMQMVSFGHAGDGNVHLCVVRGERDEETWQRELHENMDRAYAEAYRLGGVASGEHGIGLFPAPDGEGKFTGHERHQNGARPAAYLEQRKILSHRRKQQCRHFLTAPRALPIPSSAA